MTQSADPALILVIEDDPAIHRGVVDALELSGYRTIGCSCGTSGRDAALSRSPDLVLLDLALPGLPGLDVLRSVRLSQPTLPVIILTARGNESDRVQGLKAGADDYVVKPFSVRELLARVEAVLRRSCNRPADIAEVMLPDGLADLERREVRRRDGSRVELSDRECRLLRYLAAHSGRAVERRELLEHVWGLDPRGITTRTIDMHVARLREKLGDNADRPAILLTVRGKGYMFGSVVPDSHSTAGDPNP